jgi:hypothetical protein
MEPQQSDDEETDEEYFKNKIQDLIDESGLRKCYGSKDPQLNSFERCLQPNSNILELFQNVSQGFLFNVLSILFPDKEEEDVLEQLFHFLYPSFKKNLLETELDYENSSIFFDNLKKFFNFLPVEDFSILFEKIEIQFQKDEIDVECFCEFFDLFFSDYRKEFEEFSTVYV